MNILCYVILKKIGYHLRYACVYVCARVRERESGVSEGVSERARGGESA